MTEQSSLFATPAQPRAKATESDEIYEAVMRLRRAGARVFRAGRDYHLVNGQMVPNAKLLAEAAALGAEP